MAKEYSKASKSDGLVTVSVQPPNQTVSTEYVYDEIVDFGDSFMWFKTVEGDIETMVSIPTSHVKKIITTKK